MKVICAAKGILPVAIGMALSACATDYASRLSQPNFGRYELNGDTNVDPASLSRGVYTSQPPGVWCNSGYRCFQQAPLSASGWAP
jgi:hypothetical protein